MTASIGILIGVLAVELSVRIYIATSRVSIRDLRADRPVASDPSAQITLADLLEPSGNPRLIYRLRPGTRGIFRGAEVEINSLGFRGPEFSRQKSPGTIRVAGLGDSSMFGWGVEDEQTYLRVLETELQRSFGSLARVEVINGGVSGYNAAQEVEYFHESLLELDPDLVLIQYDLNDTGVSHLLMDAQPWRLDYLYLGNLLEIAR
ncbi:SGNH/GDSL hydrolase family protein, partial [Candidatus Sumerlaeota bacterium]|nr:SGNH/GDSL hydrolase family protein [Candidatus Sumerlaeota bacterium]